jgi:hypothetical protein
MPIAEAGVADLLEEDQVGLAQQLELETRRGDLAGDAIGAACSTDSCILSVSFFRSEKKLQPVPLSMIVCRVDWIMPASWRRRA